jgi:hypothetical protein
MVSKHPWPWRTVPGDHDCPLYDADGKLIATGVQRWTFRAIVAMRAEAYEAGQKAMRDRAVLVGFRHGSYGDCRDAAAEISALPLQPEKEAEVAAVLEDETPPHEHPDYDQEASPVRTVTTCGIARVWNKP